MEKVNPNLYPCLRTTATGYLATNGGKVRATNGNNHTEIPCPVAEGVTPN